MKTGVRDAAAMLTLIASFVPIGETPYGGNWAALLLITYGVLAMSAGIAICRLGISGWKRWVLPIGQAILILGTVRLCQTSPLLEELLSNLRPARAWAAGMGNAIFSDYKEIKDGNGVKIPFTRQQGFGQMNMTITVSSVKVNKGVKDSAFEIKE